MAYTKTNWVDGQAPAISAANLNKLETQYDEAALYTDSKINGGGVKGQIYSKAKTDGTDQYAVLQGELDNLVDSGGGTLYTPIGTIVSLQNLIIKNDGATPPTQPPIYIQGLGEHWSGRGRPIPTGGASVLDIRASGGKGHFTTSGLGVLGLSRVTLTDTSGGNTPFVYTTNTALKINQTSFVGSKTGLNCDQDAVILGGPNQVEGGGGLDDGFQGYGTEISGNYFQGIRRGLACQAFANGVYFENNYNSTNCGNATGGFVEIDGKPTTGVQTIAGGVFGSNIIEVPSYDYGIWVKNAVGVSFTSNDFFDGTSGRGTVGIFFETTATDNRVIGGFCDNRVTHVVDLPGRNSVDEIMLSGVSSVQTKPIRFTSPVGFGGNGGIGPQSLSISGDAAYIKSDRGPTASLLDSKAIIATRPSTVVTDASITSGSNILTSASASFISSDQGLPIFGTGIPTNTFIARVVNATTVALTKNSTATTSGVSVGFGRLGTEVTHALFERSHLVAQGSAPTIGAGAAAGSGATTSVAGYDMAGTLVIATGSSPTVGIFANITHSRPFTGTTHSQITPANAEAASLGYYAQRASTNLWQIGCTVAPLANTTYRFAYFVVQGA